MSNFMKTRPVGAELFRVDGQTDMTKLAVAFRNFANALKTYTICRLNIYNYPSFPYSSFNIALTAQAVLIYCCMV